MATVVRSRTALLVGIVVLAALVLVVADLGAPTPSTTGTEIEVVMEDYRFADAGYTVPAGQPVTFTLVNRDEVTHHVSFGRVVAHEGQRVVGFEEELFADLAPRVIPASAATELPEPYTSWAAAVHGGETVTIEVTIPEGLRGEWQLGCFTGQGCHYQAGLAATLTVE
jgi:plastocyanin